MLPQPHSNLGARLNNYHRIFHGIPFKTFLAAALSLLFVKLHELESIATNANQMVAVRQSAGVLADVVGPTPVL
jgi:hypothetical protein